MMDFNNFFNRGSSVVNFCEPDFEYKFMDEIIGEPMNVISSFIIIFFGIYGIYKSLQEENIDSMIYNYYSKILYLLLILVGFGSAYFHWDLSLFAHWIDIILISIILIFSNYCLEKRFDLLSVKFKYFFIFIIHLCTSIKIPSLHIFIQFMTGFYIQSQIESKFSIIKTTMSNEIYIKTLNEYNNIKKLFIASLFFWILDYFVCKNIRLYHTHWIFHILIGLVSYKIIRLLKIMYK